MLRKKGDKRGSSTDERLRGWTEGVLFDCDLFGEPVNAAASIPYK